MLLSTLLAAGWLVPQRALLLSTLARAHAGSTSQKNSWLRSMQNQETQLGSSSELPSSELERTASCIPLDTIAARPPHPAPLRAALTLAAPAL